MNPALKGFATMLIMLTTMAVTTAAPLSMHHISSCSECGRPVQNHQGSWCELPPKCTPFVWDANHTQGAELSTVGCNKLPSCGSATSWHGQPVATTYCYKGGGSLWAAIDPSVPLPSNCPPDPTKPVWHLPARCEEGDVNALFQWQGVWHLLQQWHARPATSVGHAVSKDLLHFDRLADVLKSGTSPSQQCYDGSSSITSKGPMLMIDGGCGFHKPEPNDKPCMESSGRDTGGVTAWPVDLKDTNLTSWKVQGPTKWKGCEGASGPSPNWKNPVTGKHQLVAINGSNGDALFEAVDDSLTSWVKVQPAFTPMRGGGGQLWHPLPMNVDGVSTKSNFTHIIQIDRRGSGSPNFVLLKFDYATSVASDFTESTSIDTGSVAFGQLSNPGGTAAGGEPGDARTIHVSWSPAANGGPACNGDNIDVGQLTSFRDLRYDPRLGPNGRLVETPIAEYYTLRGAVLAKTKSPITLPSKVATSVFLLPAGPSAADIELNLTLAAGGSVQLSFACGSSYSSDADEATTAAECGYSLSLEASVNAGCPPAPTNYTAYPGHCVGHGAGPNCAPQLPGTPVACKEDLAACMADALKSCNANPKCKSFAIKCSDDNTSPCDCKGNTYWQTFALGGSAVVQNSAWLSYTRNNGPPTPPTSQDPSGVTMCASGACTTYPLLQTEVDALADSAGLTIPVRVMTDTRSIEIFVHDGRAAYSGVMAYAACEDGPCGVSATAAGDGSRLSAVAWGMKGI